MTAPPTQSANTATFPVLPSRAAHACRMIDMAARQGAPLVVRFACLAQAAAVGQPEPEAVIARMCQRWKVPADCRDLALLLARQAHQIDHVQGSTAHQVMALLAACDALRRPERFAALLLARELNASAAGSACFLPKRLLQRCLAAAQSVPVATVAAQAISNGLSGPDIAAAVREAQRVAVDHCLSQSQDS